MGKKKKSKVPEKVKKEYTDAFKKAAKGGKGVIKDATIKISGNPGIEVTNSNPIYPGKKNPENPL